MRERLTFATETGVCMVAFLIPTLILADEPATCEVVYQRSAIEVFGDFVRNKALKNPELDRCLQEKSVRERYRQLQDKYLEERMGDLTFRKFSEQTSAITSTIDTISPNEREIEILQTTQGASDENMVELNTLENYRSIGE